MSRRIGLLSLTLVTAFALGGCSQSNPQESLAVGQARAVSSGSGVASVSVQNDWGAGYCANVTIENQGSAAISSWTVVVQVANAKLSNLWSGQYTQAGDRITITPLEFNAVIAGGSSMTLGFCATTTSATDHTPVIVSLDVVGVGDGTGGASGTGGSSGVGGESSVGGATGLGGETGAGGSSSTDVGGAVSVGGAEQGGSTALATGGAGTGGLEGVGGTSQAGGNSGSGGTSSPSTTVPGVAILSVNSDWKAGYCTDITLKNEGTAASTGWVLTLNVPQADISNLWGGSFTVAGDTVVVKALPSASSILPGASTSIGYCATTKGTSYKPSVVSFVLFTEGLPNPGTGGAAGTGGASATGGKPSTGGAAPTGGRSSTGGAAPTGGRSSTGGARATGGRSTTGGATATGGTSSQSRVTATLKITSGADWPDGYCASVDVVNNGSVQVRNWTVGVNFPSATLTNLWNGAPTLKGTLLSVAAAPYNQQIAPGASVNFGFCALITGANHTPTIASVTSTN